MKRHLIISVAAMALAAGMTFLAQGCKKDNKSEGGDDVVVLKPIESTAVPVCHLLICCRSANQGTRFLVDNEWNPSHDYRDIDQVRSIMGKIKEAGIKVVSVDFTNQAEWEMGEDGPIHSGSGDALNWPGYGKMLDNIITVCKELGMQYMIFIGNPAANPVSYWNTVAGFIWDNYAQTDTYRKYGFGDDRPILPVFLPGETLWPLLERTPDNEKDNLLKFRVGTCQVNDPIKETTSDGWGYRNQSQSSDGAVRFVCPNSGVPPQDWARVDATEWKKRVKWGLQAKEYVVFGSYDDTCDAIFWGIADVSKAEKECHRNKATANQPSAYYDVVKEALTGGK